jgi:RNA polymerase sigma-70 factor (ECF subfamily)
MIKSNSHIILQNSLEYSEFKNQNLELKIDKHKKEKMKILPGVNKSNFEQWFNEFYDGMYRYCQTMIKDRDEAEDIVQSVFLDLWKDREKIEIHTSIQAFLYKGVYFKCMNKIKSKKVENKYLLSKNHDNEDYTNDPAIYKEVSSIIDETLTSLPEQCKKIFMMSRFDGMRYLEIANTLNLSPKTIENQMGKALKIMRVALSEYLQIIVLNILIFF